MGSFVTAVREGTVKGPQQRAFSVGNWANAYESSTRDDKDQQLYQSGIWYAPQFEKLRAVTDEAMKMFHLPTSKARFMAMVGYATREWFTVGRAILKHAETKGKEGLFLTELNRLPVTGPFHNEIHVAGHIEGLVDSLRFPLSLRHDVAHPSPLPIQAENFRALLLLLFTGQHYHMLEQTWLDCIWNDYTVRQSPALIVIRPQNLHVATRVAISEFRRERLFEEMAAHARLMWSNPAASMLKADILTNQRVFSVFKRGDRFRIKSSEAKRFADRPFTFPLLRTLLPPEHAEPILGNKFRELGGLSINQVLDAYHLVSQIPDQLPAFLPQHLTVARPEDYFRFAPAFSRSELKAAFASALRIGAAESEWLLKKMTFNNSVREQLWFHPFVQSDTDELLLVAPAVAGMHFVRLLDWLMTLVDPAARTLGPLFEKWFHSKLKELFDESRLKSIVSIAKKPGLKITIAGKQEEIDMMFSVGHHVFVCELKAAQFPTEPLEHVHHRKSLDEAAEQAKRKALFVTNHVREALAQSELIPQSREAVEVHPLIVSANSLFCGWPWNDVPVCDWWIIRKFFDEAEMEFFASSGEGGTLKGAKKIPIYNSSDEAVKTVCSYFAHAPQVKIYEPFIATRDSPFPSFTGEESVAVLRTISVELPHDAIRAIIVENVEGAE